jgi:hypothetical protein
MLPLIDLMPAETRGDLLCDKPTFISIKETPAVP